MKKQLIAFTSILAVICLALSCVSTGTTTDTAKPDKTSIAAPTGNMVKNGDFANGKEGWDVGMQGSAKGTVDFDNGELHAVIEQAGDQHWNIQVTQMSCNIQKGSSYTVKFKARASVPSRTIIVNVGKGTDPWTTYANNQQIEITNEMKEYEFTFPMAEKSDAKARIEFNLAESASEVWIDDADVRLAQ